VNGGLTTEFHRDGVGVTSPVISEGNGGATKHVTPGISEKWGAGASKFMHGGLKDVNAWTDAAQNVTESNKYDAYGRALPGSSGWANRFGYGGKFGYQSDGGDLQLLGHRYYDSSTGTFITRDPIKDGRNWYSYCENNPVNAVDANGLAVRNLTQTEVDKVRSAIALLRLAGFEKEANELEAMLSAGKIKVDTKSGYGAAYVVAGSGQICLNSDFLTDTLWAASVLIHELEHIRQHAQGDTSEEGKPLREAAASQKSIEFLRQLSKSGTKYSNDDIENQIWLAELYRDANVKDFLFGWTSTSGRYHPGALFDLPTKIGGGALRK
jgi:RHS repeat-associated protein